MVIKERALLPTLTSLHRARRRTHRASGHRARSSTDHGRMKGRGWVVGTPDQTQQAWQSVASGIPTSTFHEGGSQVKVQRPEQILLDNREADWEIEVFTGPGCCPNCDRNQSAWDQFQLERMKAEEQVTTCRLTPPYASGPFTTSKRRESKDEYAV